MSLWVSKKFYVDDAEKSRRAVTDLRTFCDSTYSMQYSSSSTYHLLTRGCARPYESSAFALRLSNRHLLGETPTESQTLFFQFDSLLGMSDESMPSVDGSRIFLSVLLSLCVEEVQIYGGVNMRRKFLVS